MKRILDLSLCSIMVSVLLIAVSLRPSTTLAQVQQTREWTVMVYMNAKNNLEPYALDNFHSMALVGSSSDTAVVAQLGRPSSYRYTKADGDWSGVYRFFVDKGTTPRPKNALVDVAAAGESTDMGSPTALRQFIQWAKGAFPAKRYMLVIWNHGQGWRFMLANNETHRQQSSRADLGAQLLATVPPTTPAVGGFRAVSSDDDTGSLLYNREVQEVIASEFSTTKLDLLGYDACLMAMIETAYGLTRHVKVMVASEELEPGTGWRYASWLQRLVSKPTIEAEELGAAVVDSYEQQYGNEHLTTLSAVRLRDVRPIASKLSVFANTVLTNGEAELTALRKARKQVEAYGASVTPPLKTSVDLATLLKTYEALTSNNKLKTQSAEVRSALSAAVFRNYASTRSQYPVDDKPYGSEGLAIYFPESAQAFYEDAFHKGYLKENADNPVDFVRQESWADLLQALLKF